MNKEQWLMLLTRLRTPLAILIIAGAVGFILNLYLFVQLVLPSAQEKLTLHRHLVQLEEQRSLAAQRPIPSKVTDAELQSLVRQIPVQAEIPRLLLSIRELEKQTAVTIESIDFVVNNPASNMLENSISDVGKLNVSAASKNQDKAAADSTSIKEETFTLQVVGTYPTIMNFLEQLHKSERIIAIKQWSWGSYTAGTKGAGEATSSQLAPLLQLKLVCSTYYAPSFQGNLQSLPSIPVNSPVDRANPTATDEEYLKLLKELQNKARP